jgi:hypothetical protein
MRIMLLAIVALKYKWNDRLRTCLGIREYIDALLVPCGAEITIGRHGPTFQHRQNYSEALYALKSKIPALNDATNVQKL